jgi:hypothetical protein
MHAQAQPVYALLPDSREVRFVNGARISLDGYFGGVIHGKQRPDRFEKSADIFSGDETRRAAAEKYGGEMFTAGPLSQLVFQSA